jgi:hypothetical protein
MVDRAIFLVQTEAGRFWKDYDGNRSVTVTDVPSAATHFPYAQADAWVQRLKKRGYPRAAVCDRYGRVVTAEALQDALNGIAVAERDEFPSTAEELDAMPVAEYRKRYFAEPRFRDRADELEGTR